ncbi:PepSY domain-containing protein [Limibaculum sp. M0105]|uniref:PepSY domain-containing protein n=1 Tax=Thermohalobaculum xanthum TaxID=2753746 RepID=A0A8J7M7K0_9RHOB|nr:PepSY domain-containing protein [Thermohalobaculum xanthum]MBK0400039.1 PepSY domain-containing protein [Thermohalobaculum xanthum]
MRKLSPLALALVLGMPTAALASSDEKIPDAERARVTDAVAAQGYEVRKLEREDGLIEVYALKEGKRYELYVDGDTGEIVKSKVDD